MRPYAPDTNAGRNAAGHCVFHKTADNPKGYAKAVAKRLRRAARQEGKKLAADTDV